MAEKKRVKIDDYNARNEYDFPFPKYHQVIMDEDGQDGTVIDAEWEGKDAIHYTVTYWIKSNRDGSIKEMKLSELRNLNRNRK
jgi:hypothetical protein